MNRQITAGLLLAGVLLAGTAAADMDVTKPLSWIDADDSAAAVPTADVEELGVARSASAAGERLMRPGYGADAKEQAAEQDTAHEAVTATGESSS